MSGYPQLRDNMATRTRELWSNAETMDGALTEIECGNIPTRWHPEWRILLGMPFGTYENPFHIQQSGEGADVLVEKISP